jgi:hypothetical protein
MKREDVLRRLAALRAKFSTGSNCSPSEIETAMRMYAELKAKYDISDTAEHIRAEGITYSTNCRQGTPKQVSPIVFIIPKIGRYTDTYAATVRKSEKVTFVGTKADIEHAEWIFTLIQNGLNTAWNAYRYSFDYTKLHRAKVHGRTIRDNFHKGFIANIGMRLDAMIAEKAAKVIPGNQLAICKQALIEAFLEDRGAKRSGKRRRLAVRDNSRESLVAGYKEGAKVGLRQTIDESNTLLLEGK